MLGANAVWTPLLRMFQPFALATAAICSTWAGVADCGQSTTVALPSAATLIWVLPIWELSGCRGVDLLGRPVDDDE